MSDLIDQFAPYPKTEEEATAHNIYRHLLVSAQVTYLARVRPFTVRGGPNDPKLHIDALESFLAQWSTLHLMRHLLGHKYPEGYEQATTPDEVAQDMWHGWEDGGGPAEAMWEWLEEAGIDPEVIAKAVSERMPEAAK